MTRNVKEITRPEHPTLLRQTRYSLVSIMTLNRIHNEWVTRVGAVRVAKSVRQLKIGNLSTFATEHDFQHVHAVTMNLSVIRTSAAWFHREYHMVARSMVMAIRNSLQNTAVQHREPE